ncbi:MAG: RRXRR domain-containing protein [Xenococcaceae cyanobacterium MO_234.B1]|nr:RRXRR domain-containing protein [Xenococcaceae cyanobacterium MO_234.B1]
MYNCLIILKKAVDSQEIKQCQLKLDPGSVTTGIALLQDSKLIWAAELTHRGQQIKDSLESRRFLRRGRRARKTRYRKPRFLNRTREKGWLAPSLEHRVLTTTLKKVLAQAKSPLKDAAAVNSTRWKLFNTLKETGLPVITGTGAQTKFNRSVQGLPKRHYLDTAMVSDTPKLEILTLQPLLIKWAGHRNRQVIHVDKFGFTRTNKSGEIVRKSAIIKQFKGFQTGDIVKAIVTKGKKIGSYLGKVAIRSTGSFNIKTVTKPVQGINYKYCSIVHRKDGYLYGF